MDEKDDYYRREEDRRWREKVDHEQITLMTGHQVLDGRLDVVEEKLDGLDDVLRGNPKEGIGSLIAQVDAMENQINTLRSVIFVDSTGKKGLQHDVAELLSEERKQEFKWKFWAPVIVAFISLIGSAIINWDRISAYLTPHSTPPGAHLRGHHVTVVVPPEDLDQ